MTTTEQMLAEVITELRALRMEVAALRDQHTKQAFGGGSFSSPLNWNARASQTATPETGEQLRARIGF